MTAEVYDILGDAQKKMNNHVMLMKYRQAHFCTKADPTTLLEVKVGDGSQSMNLEDVANLARNGDYEFIVIPKDQSLIFDICKGIATSHPEFKMDRKPMLDMLSDEQKQKLTDKLARMKGDDDEPISLSSMNDQMLISCTIPPINKTRHDLGLEYSKTLYDTTHDMIETVCSAAIVRLTKTIGTGDPADLEKSTKEVKDMRDSFNDMAKKFREEKDNEIETAYKLYQEQEAEHQSILQEAAEAHGDDIVGKTDLSAKE